MSIFYGEKMSSKILNHPDKEKIIEKLLSGESVKEIESWIEKKYPRSKRLHVSYMTLQKFRAENLNIKGEVLDDIKNKKSEIDKKNLELETKMIIQSSNAYQKKIDEIASSELDVTRRLLEMDRLINSRIEHYYNILETGGSIKEDRIFLEYINTMKSLMQDWKKYIEGFADKKIEHNININVVNEHARILKETILEILKEMDPKLIPLFVDKVSYKMKQIDLNSDISNRREIIDVD
jgi:hypothetical protein